MTRGLPEEIAQTDQWVISRDVLRQAPNGVAFEVAIQRANYRRIVIPDPVESLRRPGVSTLAGINTANLSQIGKVWCLGDQTFVMDDPLDQQLLRLCLVLLVTVPPGPPGPPGPVAT